MHILITGTSNVVAAVVEDLANLKGHSVKKIGKSGFLEDLVDIENPETWPSSIDADLVIHTAWIMSPRTKEISKLNEDFAKHIMSLAQLARAKFIFISSVSASQSSKSEYGKSKFRTEQLCKNISGLNIRIGLIQDDKPTVKNGSANRALANLEKFPLQFAFLPDFKTPICSREFLRLELLQIFDSNSNNSKSIVERKKSFNKILNEDNSRMNLYINLNMIIAMLLPLTYLSREILTLRDRLLSLRDATFS